jgi:spore cortex formation protein SpoVR/YcgB (stage V sporulation)
VSIPSAAFKHHIMRTQGYDNIKRGYEHWDWGRKIEEGRRK